MNERLRSVLQWSPRVLGGRFALFLGLFALDSTGEGPAALLVHAIPALVVLLVVALAWRSERVGAAGFLALALLYAVVAWGHPSWILIISGPLLVVASLYLASWRLGSGLRAQT